MFDGNPFQVVNVNWKSFNFFCLADRDEIGFLMSAIYARWTILWALSTGSVVWICARKSNFWSRKAQLFSEHCSWNVFCKMITITSSALFLSWWHLTCFLALTMAVWAWGEKWQIESPDRDEDRIINDWSVRNVPVYCLNFRSHFKRSSEKLFCNLFDELTF